MDAVIYACLCPLGFYLRISSLRASVCPFPHMKEASLHFVLLWHYCNLHPKKHIALLVA